MSAKTQACRLGGWKRHPPLFELTHQPARPVLPPEDLSHTTHRVDQRRPDLWTCSRRGGWRSRKSHS